MLVRFMTAVYGIALALILVVIVITLAACEPYPAREPCAPNGCVVPTPR